MELLTLIPILDANLNRETISTKKDKDICSWTQDAPFTVTINNKTYTNTTRICLIQKQDTIYTYINYNNRYKTSKTKLTDIETITIGEP